MALAMCAGGMLAVIADSFATAPAGAPAGAWAGAAGAIAGGDVAAPLPSADHAQAASATSTTSAITGSR